MRFVSKLNDDNFIVEIDRDETITIGSTFMSRGVTYRILSVGNVQSPEVYYTRKIGVVALDENSPFDWETTASFDVDAQRGFTPLCPNELPVSEGHLIVPALNKQATFAKYRVGSMDWHPVNALWLATDEKQQFTPISDQPNLDLHWKAHCMIGTEGNRLLDGLPSMDQYDYMVIKGMFPDMHPYGACYHDLNDTISTGVIEFLKSKEVKTVIVGGLALDYCVKTTSLQLAKHFKVFINLDATRAIDSTQMVAQTIPMLLDTGIVLANLTPNEHRNA